MNRRPAPGAALRALGLLALSACRSSQPAETGAPPEGPPASALPGAPSPTRATPPSANATPSPDAAAPLAKAPADELVAVVQAMVREMSRLSPLRIAELLRTTPRRDAQSGAWLASGQACQCNVVARAPARDQRIEMLRLRSSQPLHLEALQKGLGDYSVDATSESSFVRFEQAPVPAGAFVGAQVRGAPGPRALVLSITLRPAP